MISVKAILFIFGILSQLNGMVTVPIKVYKKELVVGENITICCPFKPNNNQNVLIVDQNDERHFSIRNNGEFRVYKNDWKALYKNYEICMVKFINKDQIDVKILCTESLDDGLGPAVERIEFDSRVVHKPIIKSFNVLSNSTHAEVQCEASGSPNLQVIIFASNGAEIAQKFSQSENLLLKASSNILSPDNTYKCTAKTSFVKVYETSSVKKSFVSPIIEYYEPSINTLLGSSQKITLKVKANPEPSISCSTNLGFKKSLDPKSSSYIFTTRIENVEKKHLREYTCNLSNDHGKTKILFKLHVEPASSKRKSDEVSLFDDYYQLTWNTESKARLENFTVIVKERETHKIIHNDSININNEDQIESNLASLDKRSDIYTISYHVKDLMSGTHYYCVITDCNVFGCQTDSIYFETGANKNFIRKDQFSKPPVIAAAMSQDISAAPSLSTTAWPGLVSIFVIICYHFLAN